MYWFLVALVLFPGGVQDLKLNKELRFTSLSQCQTFVQQNMVGLEGELLRIYPNIMSIDIQCLDGKTIKDIMNSIVKKYNAPQL